MPTRYSLSIMFILKHKTLALVLMVGLWLLVGCSQGSSSELPTPINREAVVELYVAALENKDSNAILALHAPNNLPSPEILSHKLERLGGQPIEIIELTFTNGLGRM